MMPHLDQPEITVVIPVKNGSLFVETAVRSVMAQVSSGLRLIVSDNGSTDNTASILQSYNGYKNVTVVKHSTGMSMLGHFNKCLDMIQTEYYMLLCHDDYLIRDDALGKALGVMKAHPEISAVYCDLEYVDQHGGHLASRRFGRAGVFDQDALARRSIISMRNHFGIPLLIRTKALGTHRYDHLLPYVADVEMSLFLASAGHGFHLQEMLVANRYHSANSSRTLHRDACHQMKRLANIYSVSLDWSDIVMMNIHSVMTRFAKAIFFSYIALREWLRRES